MAQSNVEMHLSDHVAIREIVARFHDAVNHRELAGIGDLFTEDAVWEVLSPYDFRLEGRAAIATGIPASVGRTEVLEQTVSTTIVHVESPERAVARSTLSEVGRFPDGRGMFVTGTYFDHLVKRDGVWRFARRTFHPRFADDRSLSGHAHTAHVPEVPRR
ncbi:Hypothetical protein A7982_07590 [Minicystis rosea]|nr:Hypothetical protein A7982_07590 [Minicystis rosea]